MGKGVSFDPGHWKGLPKIIIGTQQGGGEGVASLAGALVLTLAAFLPCLPCLLEKKKKKESFCGRLPAARVPFLCVCGLFRSGCHALLQP